MENPYLSYVQRYLADHGCDQELRPGQKFRTRSSHCARVSMWVERLMKGAEVISPEALRMAAAFHDVGYVGGEDDHGKNSAEILLAYGMAHGLNETMIQRAAFLAAEHSNKDRWLKDAAAPLDLILLMEADLLDEEGALGLVLDCLTAGAMGGGYEEALLQMQRYEPKRLSNNPMVTILAHRYWEEKQAILRSFMQAFGFDLGIEKEGLDEA